MMGKEIYHANLGMKFDEIEIKSGYSASNGQILKVELN